MSPRVAPPMIGLGLLEAIPRRKFSPTRPRRFQQGRHLGQAELGLVERDNKVMLGRFGWKAGVPTISQQTAEAASGDIGLSTSMTRSPRAIAPASEPDCLDAPNGNSPQYQDAELGDDLFKLVSFYSHNLAVPPRRDPDNPEGAEGQGAVLFDRLRHLP